MNTLEQRSYFFDRGIRFACRCCGACCNGAPGVVRVNEQEISAIAAYSGISVSRVVGDFLYPWEDGYAVREDHDGRCLFFEDGCRIYPVRPIQCRTFPFWFSNMRSEARWETIRNECPGIGSGHLYTKNEILNILKSSM